MRTTVGKWGNSAAVRLPTSIMEESRLALDQQVDIRAEKGRIIIEPTQRQVYNLDDLLAAVTDENCHEATDWGSPIGSETW